MQNTNYVFLNAADAAIVVTVNDTVVAYDVQTADALVEVFLQHNIDVLQEVNLLKAHILYGVIKLCSDEGSRVKVKYLVQANHHAHSH